jgi:hypothetical protein
MQPVKNPAKNSTGQLSNAERHQRFC